VGLDNGDGGGTARDGVLQTSEIDDTDYVCSPVPPQFASFRGYIGSTSVTFSNTFFGVLDPDVDFSHGGINESGGDISVAQAGVYLVTAVAKLGLQVGAKGTLIVNHLDAGGGPITRLFLSDNDESGGVATQLSGSTLFELAAGDRIRFEVASSDNTGTWNVQGGNANASETVVTLSLIHP
jgi:hypothetical protein